LREVVLIEPNGIDDNQKPVEPGPTPPGRYDLDPRPTGVYLDPPPTTYGHDDKNGEGIVNPDPSGADVPTGPMLEVIPPGPGCKEQVPTGYDVFAKKEQVGPGTGINPTQAA
jgi:hypothetical protein